MSYVIARVIKVKSTAIGAMQYHNDRAPGEHLNPDIDPERTHLNYELHGEGCFLPRKYAAEVDERIAANRTSGRKVRKDAVKLVEGIITASPEFFEGKSEEECRRFFEDAYEFVKAEMGAENMIHFTVHMDETTPHAHWGAVPIKDGQLYELQDAVASKEIEIEQLKSEVKRQRSTIDRLERTISGLEERLDKAIGNIIEIADTMRWRFEPQNWRKALSRLVDNPIAHAALAVRQNVARWVEKDARAADKVIKREVKSVRKELGALAAEAQQMRTSAKQLENERPSGRPESRSKGVDR